MQKSVLVEIVTSLQKKETREVSKWLRSPAHNQRKDVIDLFDYMIKYATDFSEAYQKERAWKAIYPNQAYDDAYMRQVMYFLLKAIEEYLVFTDFMNDRVKFHWQSHTEKKSWKKPTDRLTAWAGIRWKPSLCETTGTCSTGFFWLRRNMNT
jgi:hypothetical protein